MAAVKSGDLNKMNERELARFRQEISELASPNFDTPPQFLSAEARRDKLEYARILTKAKKLYLAMAGCDEGADPKEHPVTKKPLMAWLWNQDCDDSNDPRSEDSQQKLKVDVLYKITNEHGGAFGNHVISYRGTAGLPADEGYSLFKNNRTHFLIFNDSSYLEIQPGNEIKLGDAADGFIRAFGKNGVIHWEDFIARMALFDEKYDKFKRKLMTYYEIN